MMLPLTSISQTTDPSKIWVKRVDLLKVMAAADSAKVHKVRIELLKQDTTTLGGITRQLTAALNKSQIADSISRANIDLSKHIEKLLNDKNDILKFEIADYQKALRKEKRKRFITGVSGAVLTVAAILIKK